jgi:hypothetical protein
MPGENQYKMQQKRGQSNSYFFMDECCRGGKENSINRRADKIKNRKIKQRRNTVNTYPTRLNQAVTFYGIRQKLGSKLGWDINCPY